MISPRVHVDLLQDEPGWSKARLALKTWAPHVVETAFHHLPVKPRAPLEITLTLTSDAAIKKLNRQHRNKNKATNVLSFPLWLSVREIPSLPEPVPAGDIVIAYETMVQEAKDQAKSLKAHFSHMLVHGFLHLLGYDHLTGLEADAMEALEVKVMKKLGFKNPYTPL